MKEYSIRSAQLDDLNALYEIIVSQNQRDYGAEGVTTQNLEEKWRDTAFNLNGDTGVIISSTGQVVGYGEIQHQSDSRFSIGVYFASEFSNKQVGYQFITQFEQKITESYSRRPVEISSRIGGSNKIGQEILKEAEFKRELSFITMEMMLSGPPIIPELMREIQIRPYRKGIDVRKTYEVDEETAKDKGYHSPLTYEEWTERMGIGKEYYDPALWFLAWSDEEIVGVGLNFYWSKTETGWIDHLGVKREWRRKGIGKALLLHSLSEFYKRNIKRIRLNVDTKSLTNAPKLYESVGFTPITEYHFYSKKIEQGAI